MATVVMPEIGNNGLTLLDGGINASVTTVNVDSAAALTLDNSTTDAYITVIDPTTFGKNPFSTPETQEIMRVTGVSTNALTVTRGVDGTSGTEFADNSYVMLRNNAATLQRVYDALTDGNDSLNINALVATTGQVGTVSDAGYRLVVEGLINSATSGILVTGTTTGRQVQLSAYASGAMFKSTGDGAADWFRIHNANSAGPVAIYSGNALAVTFDGDQNAEFEEDVAVGGDLTVPTKTPASASATGTVGTIAWDASYIYICVATDTWERAAIASW